MDILNRIYTRLYFEMLRIRKIEERVAELVVAGEIGCPTHLYHGEEAIAVGFCSNLDAEDFVFSTYRGHGHYLAKGGNLNGFMAELYGKATGCTKGRGGSMHLVDPAINFVGTSALVAGAVAPAVGAAFASKLQGNKNISVVFFGDGATEEGVLWESVNFAALHKLPVLFVCENNLWAVNSPLSARQPVSSNIYSKAKAFGVPCSVLINGNNVIHTFETGLNAIRVLRQGFGPVFVEAQTWRFRVHVEHYAETETRKKEMPRRLEKCPIRAFEKYLLDRGIMTENNITDFLEKIGKEINEAIDFARSSLLNEPGDSQT